MQDVVTGKTPTAQLAGGWPTRRSPIVSAPIAPDFALN